MNESISPYLSVVVPVYNEEESLPTLVGEIQAALEKIPRPAEMIFVDDGSTDRSVEVMEKLRREKERLEEALLQIRTLKGLLPICASCKKIRDDGGYWNQLETYIQDHTDAEFSHGICPQCAHRLYPYIFTEADAE